ncbi:rod shape-determining protein MreC [Eubacteriales bacterium OttesenSCG-928-N14]|nr:rod shape-determining protein MreC [Eubacteriales bacterium OttesenSCG-928-N14]
MRIFKNRPLLITMAVALVLIIMLMVIPVGTSTGGIPGSAAAGSQSLFSLIIGGVGDFFGALFGGGDTASENAQLKEQIVLLETQLQSYRELQEENARLREMLEYKEDNPDIELIPARVILRDFAPWFDVFTINVGYNRGVEVGDTVVTSAGLVGRVNEVNYSYSKVTAIIDSNSQVSCIVERTRDHGTIVGGLQMSDDEGICYMEQLDINADLVPGDRIVTTDLGGNFPKGIVVGEVLTVGSGANRQVTVQPAVDFLHLEEVMIRKSKPATGGEAE